MGGRELGFHLLSGSTIVFLSCTTEPACTAGSGDTRSDAARLPYGTVRPSQGHPRVESPHFTMLWERHKAGLRTPGELFKRYSAVRRMYVPAVRAGSGAMACVGGRVCTSLQVPVLTKRASPATETARAARLFGVRRQSPACAGRRRRFCCTRAACANLRSRRHARAAEEKRRQAAAPHNASPRPARRKPNAPNASSRWGALCREPTQLLVFHRGC